VRGRKPTPTSRKVLEGNPGKRALNDREPQPDAPSATPVSAPFDTPPAELLDYPHGAAEWTRIAPMMRRARQITEADRSALLALCIEWDRYLSAMAKVKKNMVVKAPSGYPMTNPYLSIATRALASCQKLWPELGLTPSSRSRVRTDGPGPDGDAFSEFDEQPVDVTH